MKKTLALTLALVLALGLASPALAEEVEVRWIEGDWGDLMEPISTDEATELKSIADEPPEVQEFLREMYEAGLLQENTDYDLSYFEADPYAEYEAAHPEEFENLDVDALIAGWGYEDINKTAQEQFMASWGYGDKSLEEAVKDYYIHQRLLVEDICADAEECRAEYPEVWESFDADSYFEAEWMPTYADKAAYMAYWNIATQEEFADDMFVDYMNDYCDDGWDYPEEEPTLTLMVNGVASDVVIAANDWTTYADAADLRAILGDEAVGQGYEGPVPIREAAENMGWDVQWYDGGWYGVRQEVQLWDKAAFEAELDEEFGPYNDFMAKVMKMGMAQIFSEEPISGHETVDVNLTRFSTLDGDKKYTLTLGVDYVVQKGVMDVTITFDVAQLLQLYAPSDLAAMAQGGGFTVSQLTALLEAGKAELILDYNENAVAYNVPLLALIDEEAAGWHTIYSGNSLVLPDRKEWEDVSFVSAAYAKMMTVADYAGAEQALSGYQSDMGMYTLFLGKDRFATQNGKTTYSLTAQDVNRGLSAIRAKAFGEEDGQHSFFKRCELAWSVDDRGNTSMNMHLRPDMEGIATFAGLDESGIGVASGLRWLLPFFDMDVTASGSGNQSHSSSQMSVHWNNVGTLEMKARANTETAAKGPRQIKDVERLWVQPTPGTVLTQAK